MVEVDNQFHQADLLLGLQACTTRIGKFDNLPLVSSTVSKDAFLFETGFLWEALAVLGLTV